MPIDKLSANAFATGAIANSLGYTPANKAGDTFSGAVSGITTLAAGNTTITGFANVTTTLTAGNTSITGLAAVGNPPLVWGASTGVGPELSVQANSTTHAAITIQAGLSRYFIGTPYNNNVLEIGGNGSAWPGNSANTNGAKITINPNGVESIKFGPTQVASSDPNTLDDYEEGSWTPSLGGFSSVNYNYRLGTYVKIGKMAYVFWDFDVSSRSGTWNDRIDGLPFTVLSTLAGYSVALHRDSSIFNTGVSGGQLKGFVNQNTTYIAIQVDYSGTSGFGYAGQPGVNASGRSTGCVMYMTSN